MGNNSSSSARRGAKATTFNGDKPTRSGSDAFYAEATALDELASLPDSLLNPHRGAIANDVLEHHLRPMVRAPRLVVCGLGGCWCDTYTLPLSASSPQEWALIVKDGAKMAKFRLVVHEREILATGATGDYPRIRSCLSLSPRTAVWRDGPPLPLVRSSHCAAELGDISVVSAGGIACTMCEADYLAAFVLRSGSRNSQWTRAAEMQTARSEAGSAAVNVADPRPHRMIVLGGYASRAAGPRADLDTCEFFDAVANRWSALEARLPQPMQCHAAPIDGGAAVLAVQNNDNALIQCALVDVRASAVPVASPGVKRHAHAVAAVGEHSVVLIGGEDDNYTRSKAILLYDARADRWREQSHWQLPWAVSFHCALVFDERAIACSNREAEHDRV